MSSMTGKLTMLSQMFQRLTTTDILIQTRNYAARRSTRERKLKILRAIKAKKLARLAQQKLDVSAPKKYIAKTKNIEIPEYIKQNEYVRKPLPNDDVYIELFHQWKVYSLEEAIKCHKEFCHPTIMNKPDAFLSLFVELNMKGVKKTKPLSMFTRIAPVPHIFDHKCERIVAAFCKTSEEMETAKTAGAAAVFGPAHIKEIARGSILLDDFTVFVAHPSVLPELTTIKGFMRRQYPMAKNGTLSDDLTTMIKMQLHGIEYTVKPYPEYREYGRASILIGQINMDVNKLKENCTAVLSDLHEKKPKRPGPFVLRLRLACENSPEKFKLDMSEFYTEVQNKKKSDRKAAVEEEEDDEEENVGVISSV